MLSFLHPGGDVLANFAHGELDARTRDRTAAHLRECDRCQDALRFQTKLDRAATTPASPAPNVIFARALATRGAGERRILPSPANARAPQRSSRHRLGWSSAIAASIIVIAAVVVSRPHDVTASAAQSEMRILPAQPRAGDSIRVVYRPSAGLFAGSSELVLRARLRMPGDAMYGWAVPVSRVKQVAILHRSSSGDYTGSFRLPDSIVFASVVVEDSLAAHLDDNAGRLWEVLTHDAGGTPAYAALDQRVNDLMGRSWEEAYATSKRMTQLYPDRYDSWSLRVFFERALFGDAGGDSLAKAYDARMSALIAAAKARPSLSDEEIGTIFFARRTRAYRDNSATGADTAEMEYWLNRMLREHPRHMQLAQHYAFHFTPEQWKHPGREMLDSLERLYARFAPLTGPGTNLILSGERVAESMKDDSAYRRWSERSAEVRRGEDSKSLGLALLQRPHLRTEGQAMLRRILASPPEALARARRLQEDRRAYLRRADGSRSTVLAALGESLVAEGKTRAALDTLGLAAKGNWDPGLFNSLRAAYAVAGDSMGVQVMRARAVVDPRTPADSVVTLTAAGRGRNDNASWGALVNDARHELRSRLLEQAIVRPLRGAPSLDDAGGKTHTLRSLTEGKPTAVIFWSRHCGFAIEALPTILGVADRMTREGSRVLFVVDEPPSTDIKRYLASRHWSLPVYHDTRSEMRSAFASFGTPAYYVIDEAGRIRFSEVNGEAELIAQVEALRSERGKN
ncbi:MAG: redoxin domain-containing protein [Gemmatimonadaceae bacterium]